MDTKARGRARGAACARSPADAARARACARRASTARRDNCLLVRHVETCLQKILVARDVAGAVAYVKATIADLLMNRMDLSLLVITKGLTQEVEEYVSKAAHVELARKTQGTRPGDGARRGWARLQHRAVRATLEDPRGGFVRDRA
jgi:DNA polymerase elongation subunit (family B)